MFFANNLNYEIAMSNIKPEYANIVILDYKSLYPYTMIRNNISFDTIRLKILSLDKPYTELYARQELMKLMLPENPSDHELEHFYRYTGTGRAGSKLFGFLYVLEPELLVTKYADIVANVEIIDADYTRRQERVSFKDIYDYIQENRYNVTFNGAVFDSKELGIIPITEMTFLERREHYKSLLEQAKESNAPSSIILRYDGTQLSFKVMANAGFGASGNIGFFGFDPYIFEGITLTAQYYSIVGTYLLNEYVLGKDIDSIEINKQSFIIGKSEYNRNNQRIALYTDTDSVILYLKDVLPDANKRMSIIQEIADVFNNHLSPKLVRRLVIDENFYEQFKEFNPKFKVEFIGSKALFTRQKKRYIILDAQFADKDADWLLENFDKAFKVAGFEVIKEVSNAVYKSALKKFFVYVVTGRIRVHNQFDILTLLKEIKADVKDQIRMLKARIQEAKENSSMQVYTDFDELLSELADTVSWKSTKHVFLTIDDILKETGTNSKKLKKILDDIPSHVLSMIVYNTLRKRAVFTPGSKGYGFKTKHNKKLLADITRYITKELNMPLMIATVFTQKIMSLNQFVSAYDDIEYILTYMDWDNIAPQLYSKIENRIKELVSEITGGEKSIKRKAGLLF